MVFCDGNHGVVLANQRFLSMFGFTRDDVVGRPVDGLIVPPQLAVEAAEISVSVARGKPVSMETVRTRSDGSPILVSVIASRCSPPCEGYSYYAIYRELVSQRGRRRRWGESTDSGFLTALFEDADEPGLFTDSRGMVNAVNHSFCRQFGWKPGELAGTDLLRTLVPPDMAGAEEEARKMLLGGAIVNTETVILDAYGSRRSTGLTAVPVSLDGGAAGSYRAYCPPALALPENLEVKGKNRFRDPPFSHLPGVFFRVRHDASRTVGFLSRPDLPGSSGRSEPLPRNEGLSWGVHSDDLENLRETLDSSAGTGRPYQITYRMVDPSGERWVLEQGCPDDDRLGFEGYIVDITATKRVEEMVARARRRLEDLHGIAGRLQRSATESEIYRICAEAACSILDADCGMVLVKNGGEVEVAYKTVAHGSHCPEDCHTELASVVLETGKPFSYTSREGHNTGCAFSGNGVCRPLTENSVFLALSRRSDAFTESLVGITDLLLGYAEQSLRRISLQRKLIDQAIHDPLTGAYNRNHFNRLVDLEESRARREGTTLGFIMVDVDSFKAINDTRGHQAGDTVLREVAAVLQRAVRKSDSVIRYGGDEFLLILSRVDSNTEMVEKRIRSMLEKDVSPGFTVTVSMGHSQWNADMGVTIDEAISRADSMMYSEKRSRQTDDHQSGGTTATMSP